MRELSLFREYLLQLRAERSQQEHAHALNASSANGLFAVSGCAHQVLVIETILDALKELDSDQDEFVHRYLQR